MSETIEFEAVERENLGDIVYGRIADALIKGRFVPGARLTIRDLAQSLGTSVTPVRDAILRLIQDEALDQKTPRDVRVPVITEARYREIRQIRVKLEGLAARETALKAQAADIAQLRGLIERNEQAIADQAWFDALSLNQTFHFALADTAKMTVLSGILYRLWLQMGPLIAECYAGGGRLMIDNHYRILRAVEDRNPDAAEAAIAEDILEAGELIIDKLRKRQAHADES